MNEEKLKELLVTLVNTNNVFTGRDKEGNKISAKDFVDKIFEKEEKPKEEVDEKKDDKPSSPQ